MDHAPTVSQALIQGRIFDQPRMNSPPLFSDWSYTQFNLLNPPSSEELLIAKHLPPHTRTSVGLISLCIAGHDKIPESPSQSSSIIFWSNAAVLVTPDMQLSELTKAIKLQYHIKFPQISINSCINPKMEDYRNFFKTNRHYVKHERILMHFLSEDISTIEGINDIPINTLLTMNGTFFGRFPFKDILHCTFDCGVHIIDCDYAGLLKPFYEEFLTEQRDLGYDANFVAFFSCSAKQKPPRSPGLPTDLFSSCLTSPAKTVILWHSWHYFCFKTGALTPLTIEQANVIPESLLNEVSDVLKRIIESMLSESVIKKELKEFSYYQLFRSDDVVDDLTVGFVLACHIFDFFNITPLSIPALPNVSKHPMWHYLDLYLDAALLKISNPEAQIPSFYQQSLDTLNLLLKSGTTIHNYLPHMGILSLTLGKYDFKNVSCEILAKVLDCGMDFIKAAFRFPIFIDLMYMMKNNSTNPALYLCIAKMMAFYNGSRDIMKQFLTPAKLRDLFLPMIEGDDPLFPLIVLTLYLDKNRIGIEHLLASNWINSIVKLTKNESCNVRCWAALYVSSFAEEIKNHQILKTILDAILPLTKDLYCEVRVAAIYALQFLTNKSFDDLILDAIIETAVDINPSTRCQLIILLSIIYQKIVEINNYAPILTRVVKVISDLLIDPYPTVSKLAKDFSKAVTEGRNAIPPTFTFDWFIFSIFAPLSPVLEDSSKLISRLQPLSSQSLVEPEPESLSFKQLKKGIYFDLDFPVSTNFCLTSQNELICGTSQGQLLTWNWETNTKAQGLNLNNFMVLTHLQFLPNSGYNIILASSSNGDLYTLLKQGPNFAVLSAFNMIPTKRQNCQVMFDCDSFRRKLYCYASSESNDISVYDLNLEKPLYDFRPQKGNLRSAHCLKKLDEMIAICGDNLELFDTRMPTNNCVLSFESTNTLFDCGPAEQSPYIFAVCHEDCSVSYVDWRQSMEDLKCYKPQYESQALSFCVHESSYSCAVGHTRGAVVVDINETNRFEYPPSSSFFYKQSKPILQVFFHPRKYNLAMLQSPHDLLTFVEI